MTLGGLIAIGAAWLGSRKGLSQRMYMGLAAATFGAAQAVAYGVGSVRRRRKRKREAEIEYAMELRNTMAWNEALGAVRTIVDTFSLGLAEPFTLKHMILDLELLRRHHTALFEEEASRNWEPSCDSVLEEGRYFANFAMASYGYTLLRLIGLTDPSHDLFTDGADPIEFITFQLCLNREDVLMANMKGNGKEFGIPRHFIARDRASRSIVIAVRGTNSVSDLMLDLLCDSAPFGKGYAHSGMKDAAESLYAASVPTLRKALHDNKGYSLVVAGHSLGGGVAILLTKILLDKGFRRTRCFAIAPCPVFGPMYCVDERWKRSLECFVHRDDFVPQLSLMSARALVMEIERIDGMMPMSDNELRGQTSEGLRAAIEETKCNLERDQREIAVAPLFIPVTHVHWLLPKEDGVEGWRVSSRSPNGSYRSVRAKASVFSRMLLTSQCVTSHFPNNYIRALNSLGLPTVPARAPRNPPLPSNPRHLHYNGELGS